jgi:hypothetical protein
MNHPGCRAYQRFMVRSQIETGHDASSRQPAVHNKGCHCPHLHGEVRGVLKA